MKNHNLIDIRKRDFVRNHMELFEVAYFEITSHKTHSRYGKKFQEFIRLAREEFKYSKSTVSKDIWSKFCFTEIIMGINDRKKQMVYNEPRIRKVLGYIENVE